MFVINVFGLGIIYRVIELPNNVVRKMETLAQNANLRFPDVLFDYDVLEKCGIHSFNDLPVEQQGVGCLIHSETSVEIRQQRRKLITFPLSDFANQNYLFPIYNLKEKLFEVIKKEGFHYFFLYEVIKGRIVKYFMHNFHGMDNLEFQNTRFEFENQSLIMLTGIKHKGHLLVPDSDDSVVIEQHVLKL